MKKIITLLLTIVCLFSFVSCKKPHQDSSESTSGSNITSDVEEEKEKPLVFVGNMIEKNTALYSILIPDEENESIEYAANEIVHFASQVTGVTLRVVRENAYNANNRYIALGDTVICKNANLNVDYEQLNLDGYVMVTDASNNLIINGFRNSGILNGAYDFIERFFGVKFMTRDYNYIPTLETVALYETNIVSVPDFATRDVFANQTMEDKAFAARMKLNSKYGDASLKYGENGINSYYAGDGHTLLYDIVPYSVYGASHPDWYYKDGQELRYTNGLDENDNYDSTNTESLIYNVIEVCKGYILANPNATYFMLGQPDNGVWDDSPEAVASKERNGGRSGTLMVFMNTVAAEIEKWIQKENIDSDVLFVTFAYWKTIDAPVKEVNGEWVPYNDKVKARDNVAVKIAHMTCTYHSLYDTSCSENVQANLRFKQWSAITDSIFVWDYITNFSKGFYWFPHYNSIVQNLEFYKECGVIEIMSQGQPHASQYYQQLLDDYLYSHLMWDMDQDVNALIREFNHYYFGEESAKAVDEFVDLMFYHYGSLGGDALNYHTDLYATKDFFSFDYYPIGFLEKACKIINDEINAVQARTDLNAVEREQLILKLKRVLVHPMYMILDNYDAYYDSMGKKAYAKEFIDMCGELGIEYYSEGASIGDLKTQFGVV